MTVCPVCEHVQDRGDTCDVCGWRLPGPGAIAEPVPPVEGLEPTALDATSSVEDDRVEGLEPTRFDAVVAAEETAAWVERTALEAVGAVATEAVELEHHASTPEPRFVPGRPACRYCATAIPPGTTFCPRCGMRWAALRAAAEAPARRCAGCGAAVGPDSRACPVCGASAP